MYVFSIQAHSRDQVHLAYAKMILLSIISVDQMKMKSWSMMTEISPK